MNNVYKWCKVKQQWVFVGVMSDGVVATLDKFDYFVLSLPT